MKFNEEQTNLLKKIGVSKTDDEADVEEKVSAYLQEFGFDGEYNPTNEGRICESILDMLS